MRRIVVVLGVFAMFATLAIGASAQQGNWAVVDLDEADGSGFEGVAVLREAAGRTEMMVVVRPPEGLLSFLQPGAEEIGNVAIHEGTCDQPGTQVTNLGQPRRIGGEESNTYASVGAVQTPLSELLSGSYIVVVHSSGANGTATPTMDATPSSEGAEDLLACGEITETAETTPAPGDGRMPGTTPTPGMTPVPTPDVIPDITPSPGLQ